MLYRSNQKSCFVFSGPLILVATGGIQNTDKSQVLDVSSSSTFCSNLPSYPLSLHGAAGGVINGSPIICGGTSGPHHQTCYRFEKITNSWKLHCSMESARAYHATSIVNGALFVTGGLNGGNMASTEFIHANGNVTSGTNLPVARYGHCMVTLHDGKVMILGAANPTSQRKNVIIYDPEDNTYTNGPSMSYERRDSGCTLFNSALHNGRPVVLAAGGSPATAEVYDYTNANQWQTSIHIIICNILTFI